MSTTIGIFIGVGERNFERLSAFSNPESIAEEVGAISGSHGFERVKICNSVIELPAILPDLEGIKKRLISGRQQAEREASRAISRMMSA